MTAFVSIERPVLLRWQSPAVERSAGPSATGSNCVGDDLELFPLRSPVFATFLNETAAGYGFDSRRLHHLSTKTDT
jgi:hypothetical protein